MFTKTLLVILLCAVQLPAQVIYNLTPEDDAFLQYLDFRNTFTYSGVEMRFGEVTLKSQAGEVRRVPLVEWTGPEITIQDAAGNIDQTDLAPYSRTEPFELPAGEETEISFFRNIGMWAPSAAFPPAPDDPPGGGSENTPWDILDKTEFEVQLRDAATDDLVMVLNTAGIDAHDDPYSKPWYGSAPRQANHTVMIPASHAGRNAYVQVIARRWGPSPYGLTLMKDVGYMVNESSMVDEHGNMLRQSEHTQLLEDWFQEVLAYCDDRKAEDGWLPESRHWLFSPHQYTIFEDRYYVPETINGSIVMAEIAPEQPSKSSREVGSDQLIVVPKLRITSITPNPVRAGQVLSVSLSGAPDLVHLRLVNSRGVTVAELWSGTVQGSEQMLELSVDSGVTAAGSYSLVAVDAAGAVLSRSALTLLR